MDLAGQVDLFASVPFEPALRIDNTSLLPHAVAHQIAAHFGLPAHEQPATGQG